MEVPLLFLKHQMMAPTGHSMAAAMQKHANATDGPMTLHLHGLSSFPHSMQYGMYTAIVQILLWTLPCLCVCCSVWTSGSSKAGGGSKAQDDELQWRWSLWWCSVPHFHSYFYDCEASPWPGGPRPGPAESRCTPMFSLGLYRATMVDHEVETGNVCSEPIREQHLLELMLLWPLHWHWILPIKAHGTPWSPPKPGVWVTTIRTSRLLPTRKSILCSSFSIYVLYSIFGSSNTWKGRPENSKRRLT